MKTMNPCFCPAEFIWDTLVTSTLREGREILTVARVWRDILREFGTEVFWSDFFPNHILEDDRGKVQDQIEYADEVDKLDDSQARIDRAFAEFVTLNPNATDEDIRRFSEATEAAANPENSDGEGSFSE